MSVPYQDIGIYRAVIHADGGNGMFHLEQDFAFQFRGAEVREAVPFRKRDAARSVGKFPMRK